MLGNLLKAREYSSCRYYGSRANIVALPINSNLDNTLKLFLKASHSRMPVYNEQLDNIVGMIHVKDLLNFGKK